MPNKKTYFLSTEKYGLRPISLIDIDGPYQDWLNDPEITAYNAHGRFPKTKEDLTSYITSANTNTQLVFAIDDKELGLHIGNISLQSINWIDRNAEIAFLLGDKNYWNKGVMFDAGKCLINHAFNCLNLHRVHCGTSSDNLGMQKLAVKLGMKEEGRRSEALYKKGKFFDIIEYGIINHGSQTH